MDQHEVFNRHQTRQIETIIADKIADLARKEDIEEIVTKAMFDSLKKVGLTSKGVIVAVASVVIAIGVIFGGVKWILALVGYSIIKPL